MSFTPKAINEWILDKIKKLRFAIFYDYFSSYLKIVRIFEFVDMLVSIG